MLWKCYTQYASKLGKHQWPQDWKRSVFITIPKKGNAKECSNYCTTVLISHTKFSKSGFYSRWTENFQMFKMYLEKEEEPEIKMPTSIGSSKKQEFQKNIYFCFRDYAKGCDLCGSQQIVKNSKRDRNTRPPYCLLQNLCAGQEVTVRTRYGTTDWL